MKRLFAVSALILSAQWIHAQAPDATARAAAVRFAIANGLELPTGIIVAIESIVDSTRPSPTASRISSREADAKAIASVIGPTVRAVSIMEAGLVECFKLVCVSTTNTPFLVASDPETTEKTGTIVKMSLFSVVNSPGSVRRTLVNGLVKVEHSRGGWVGVSWYVTPGSVTLRLPPP